VDAREAQGATDEGWIDTLRTVGPLSSATVEMTIRRNGPALGGGTVGFLYSDRTAQAPPGSGPGLSMFVANDGALVACTGSGVLSDTCVGTSMNSIAVGVWYHVAVTIRSAGMSILINGDERFGPPESPNWGAPIYTAWLGASRDANSPTTAIHRFNGVIDEVRVSNVVRYP
jgi:hypothetical protein